MPLGLHALSTFFAIPAFVSAYNLVARPNLPDSTWIVIVLVGGLLWLSGYLEKGDKREVIQTCAVMSASVCAVLYFLLLIRTNNIRTKMDSPQLALDFYDMAMLYAAGISTFAWVMTRAIRAMIERQLRRRRDIVPIEHYRKKKAAGHK